MNADVHTLTGAYVLDALADDERAEFEQHLAECAACTREVAELQATAARLGAAVAVTPPESLRGDVLSRIRHVRQLAPESGAVVALRRRWPLALAAVAAAAAAVVAVVLGVRVAGLSDDLSRAESRVAELEQVDAELARVLVAPDARVVTGGRDDGGSVVVSQRLGRVAFVPSGLPAPAAGRVYQLWLIGPDDVQSAGLLPSTGRPVVVELTPDAAQFGVTVEPAGGSPQPTTEPVLLLRL